MQETYARWYAMSQQQQGAIGSPGAWLTKVASRICLDLLGSARAWRESYVGEWIPEPLPGRTEWINGRPGGTMADPADRVTLDESINMAFLVVLESMTPADGVTVTVFAFDVTGGRIKHIWAVRTPRSSGPGRWADTRLLLSLYKYPIPAFLLLLVAGERMLAEEILQDTMLAVWRGAGSFRGESSVRSWVIAVTRRVARSWFPPSRCATDGSAFPRHVQRMVAGLADPAAAGGKLQSAVACFRLTCYRWLQMCSKELIPKLDAQHLALPERAGLISRRKHGREVLY